MRAIKIIFTLALATIPAHSYAWCPDYTYENGGSDRYETRLLRSSPWVDDVVKTLVDEGLEPKWVYLMLAESGGKLDAKSEVGAGGPWQLMPATARHYGCENRVDPVESTRAAARYIKHLLAVFHSERLAIIGYNMGGANFRRAGRATRQAAALANDVMCLFENDPLHMQGY